ncbi:MAG: TMEM43 family protein [Akkermansia sp.]|nr:TMEM43 family protein [Akkermansia sp.]
MAIEEVTTESWGSRLGGSFKGILTGGVIFLAAIPLLFWNEGRAVKTAKALEEGEAACVALPTADSIDPQYEGKLVHLTGNAVTQDTLTDGFFPGISLKAIELSRRVEYYQWVESESTREEKQVGGSVKKITTYSYSKKWVSEPEDSSSFKEAGHDNIVHYTGVENENQNATNVTLGAFTLTPRQISSISGDKPVDLKDVTLPQELTGRTAVSGNVLYIGAPASATSMPLPNGMQPGVAQQLPASMYVTVDSYPGQQLLVLDDPTCGALIQGPTGEMYPMVADEAAQTAYMMVNNTQRTVTGYGDLTTPAPTMPMQLPGLINVDRLGVLPVVCFGDKAYVRTADNRLLLIKPWQNQYMVSNNGVMLRAHINLAPTAANGSTVNPGAPEVGDVRITWTYIPDTVAISVASCQMGNTFTPYVAENGYKVDLLQMGTRSKDLMFQAAKDGNTMWTWILRLVGWFMMYIGIGMILKPLSVLGDVLPIIGNILEFGISIISFFVSSIVALVVISIAWLFYRPLLGIVLLAAAGGLVWLLIKRKKKSAPAAPAEAPAE